MIQNGGEERKQEIDHCTLNFKEVLSDILWITPKPGRVKIVSSRLATTKMDSDQIADLDFQTRQITVAISTHICLNWSIHTWFIGIGEKILLKQSAMTTKNEGQKAAHDTTNLT